MFFFFFLAGCSDFLDHHREVVGKKQRCREVTTPCKIITCWLWLRIKCTDVGSGIEISSCNLSNYSFNFLPKYAIKYWINTVYKPYMNFQRDSCFYDKSAWDLLDQMGISNQRAHSPFIMNVICWQDQRKRTRWFWTLFWNFFILPVLKVHCISQTTYLLLSHQKRTCAIDDMILSKLM